MGFWSVHHPRFSFAWLRERSCSPVRLWGLSQEKRTSPVWFQSHEQQSSQNCCDVHSSHGHTVLPKLLWSGSFFQGVQSSKDSWSSLEAGPPLSTGSPTGSQPPPGLYLLWHRHLTHGLCMDLCIPLDPHGLWVDLCIPLDPRGLWVDLCIPLDPRGLWVDLCIPMDPQGLQGHSCFTMIITIPAEESQLWHLEHLLLQ